MADRGTLCEFGALSKAPAPARVRSAAHARLEGSRLSATTSAPTATASPQRSSSTVSSRSCSTSPFPPSPASPRPDFRALVEPLRERLAELPDPSE